MAFSPPKIDESKLVTTPSGLKYQIFEMGKGAKVAVGETVKVHYHGMLQDGKVFDSSYRRGEPIQFPLGVGRVIKGWDEGIALMPKGSKGVLIVPPDLGYGSRDMGTIPPNSTLTFFVEVLE
ncbi:MAG: FKBP-type peptidyl-prolyl cis-trans isomerase [Bacteroidia bacterium]|nr:FKBP-type peptidyl-prolyl cis-trans isomerase [Bacteroidia bacterium]